MDEAKKSKKGLAVGIAVVLLLLAAVGITIGLALSDPYAGTVQAAAQPETVVTKLAESLLTGEPAVLTKEEVSGLLAGQVDGLQGGGFQVLGLQCVSVEDGIAEFYIPYPSPACGWGSAPSLPWDAMQNRRPFGRSCSPFIWEDCQSKPNG